MAKLAAELRAKSRDAVTATIALISVSGGEATATIDRTKKPVVIASVTNAVSLSARLPEATLAIVHSAPAPTKYPHMSLPTLCGANCIRRQHDRTMPAMRSSATAAAIGTRTDAMRPAEPSRWSWRSSVPAMTRCPARSSHGANVQPSTRRSASV